MQELNLNHQNKQIENANKILQIRRNFYFQKPFYQRQQKDHIINNDYNKFRLQKFQPITQKQRYKPGGQFSPRLQKRNSKEIAKFRRGILARPKKKNFGVYFFQCFFGSLKSHYYNKFRLSELQPITSNQQTKSEEENAPRTPPRPLERERGRAAAGAKKKEQKKLA